MYDLLKALALRNVSLYVGVVGMAFVWCCGKLVLALLCLFPFVLALTLAEFKKKRDEAWEEVDEYLHKVVRAEMSRPVNKVAALSDEEYAECGKIHRMMED